MTSIVLGAQLKIDPRIDKHGMTDKTADKEFDKLLHSIIINKIITQH